MCIVITHLLLVEARDSLAITSQQFAPAGLVGTSWRKYILVGENVSLRTFLEIILKHNLGFGCKELSGR